LGRRALPIIAALTLSACGGGETTSDMTTNEPPPSADAGNANRHEGDQGEAPPTEATVLSSDQLRDLERFASDAPGRVGIAVTPLGDGDPQFAGDADTGRAWSTMKVPLLVALLDRIGGEKELSSEERAQAEAALTRSDNDAALALFDRLGELEGGVVPASHAIEDVLRRSGDDETMVNTKPSPEGFSTFGQTVWRAEASTLFFRALAGGCLLDTGDTDYVLSLMESVAADQRWGLGEAEVPAGSKVAFKGGWGPEPDGGYLVRQSGVVSQDDAGYVLSVIAFPGDTGSGSFAAGQDLVTEAARMVSKQASTGPRGAVTCES
jgi:beta-lactamase class A